MTCVQWAGKLGKKTSETRLGSRGNLGPGGVQGQSPAGGGVQVGKVPWPETNMTIFQDIVEDDF